MTRSGSAGNWDYNIYLDGVNDGSANTPNNPHTQQGCAIGRFGHSSSGYFSGLIDEVGIWNVELNGTQVNNIYNLGTPSDLTSLNPVAWYRMGDNGIYKYPQWLLPSNENKDKVSNYSMSFDGTNDYIDCGDSDMFSFGNGSTDSAFSISCWVNFNGNPSNWDGIVTKWDASTGKKEYLFYLYQNKLRILLGDSSSGALMGYEIKR